MACDESGYEGEKLVDTTGVVFAHAGVAVDEQTAADCLEELRSRIQSPASEYGASHVLREKHRDARDWLFGPDGPLLGNGRVHLIDKEYFLVVRLVELLTDGEDPRFLYDDRRCFDPEHWHAFLATANDLLRHRDRWDRTTPVDSFFHMVELLRGRSGNGVLRGLDRKRAEAFREQLFDDPQVIRPADPLMPAILRQAEYWGPGAEIAHDRQNLLTRRRIELIKAGGSLRTLRLVDSAADPRVQLADMLAGVVRVAATAELQASEEPRPRREGAPNLRVPDDPTLTELVGPYLDDRPVWADDASRRRLSF